MRLRGRSSKSYRPSENPSFGDGRLTAWLGGGGRSCRRRCSGSSMRRWSPGSANPARTRRRDDAARGGVGRVRPRRVCRDWSPPVHRGASTPAASRSSTALYHVVARGPVTETVGSRWTALSPSLSRDRVESSSASRRSGAAAIEHREVVEDQPLAATAPERRRGCHGVGRHRPRALHGDHAVRQVQLRGACPMLPPPPGHRALSTWTWIF